MHMDQPMYLNNEPKIAIHLHHDDTKDFEQNIHPLIENREWHFQLQLNLATKILQRHLEQPLHINLNILRYEQHHYDHWLVQLLR